MQDWRWISLEELESRRGEWQDLASDGEFPSAFADPAWILAWWRNYGQQREPWTLALDDRAGTLRGLALMALERSRGARTLHFAGESWNGIETLLCAPGEEARISAALLEALAQRGSKWDLWRIQRLRADSVLGRELLEGDGPLRAAAHDLRVQPFLELPADVDAFEASFGSKQRSTQRRKWRRLSELGATVEAVEEPARIAPALNALLELRRRRAVAMGQRHTHMDERYERFLLEAVSEMLPARARLWRMELDGDLLASRLNLLAGSREHSYLLGLSEMHVNLSPGNSLELHAIRQAIEQGRTELELGPGRDEYKYRLGGCDRTLTRLVVSSGSARGRAFTTLAAADLRLRDSAAAERLRRRRGITPERPTAEHPARYPPATAAAEGKSA